ncbi:hypothetical protein HRG_001091 [Hirsutella rhossiliensis]|uniref:DUF7029 domain-containing protein n=1 Tax=Hirsutella rhossiliensis TaxID=111463 RepID=A0A9P8SNI9_9HYPO|nr:uncharacterized protein HRG_01091 [Hirsutella rhossiliensis]KAH0968449.1 hypothetical protein HRG_01091 [Hirsutella rhossiliensis]
MFYGNSDPAKAGAFAFVSYYFTSQSVNLDHSDHVSVSCVGADSLAVTFNSQEAFEHASNTWSAKDGLILIAYAKRCGGYEKGQRCYFDVSSLEVDASSSIRTIVARGQSKHPDDITSGGDTEWGWWNPRNSNGGAQSDREKGAKPDFSWNAGPTPTPGSGSGSGSGSGASKPSGRPPCAAPPDAKYGRPTACLGEYFDMDLDNGLGYEPLGDKSRALLNDLAPGLDLGAAPQSSSHGLNRTAAFPRRHQRDLLVKRGFWSSTWSGAVNTVKKVLSNAYDKVVKAVNFSGGYKKEFSWALPDPNNQNSEANKLVDSGAQAVVSPWGNAVLLKSFGSPKAEGDLTKYLNIFCVDCGARVKASVAGKASWSMLHGITEGRVEFNTDMHFGLKLGVDAHIRYKSEFSMDLFRVGLPGLSYGVVTIAPQVSVGTRVGLEAAAKGRLLAGAEVGLQASRVVIDLVDSSKNEKSGWEPYFKPVLEAEGEIMLSASLALPVGLECGIAISEWHKTVAIIDEPSIKATAQAAAAMSLANTGSFSAGFNERDGCAGISTQITWRNKVFINVVDLETVNLHDTGDRALVRKCFALPAYKGPSQPLNVTESKSKRSEPLALPPDSVSDLTSEYPAHGSKYVTSAPKPLNQSSYSEVNGFNYARLVTPGGKAMVVSCGNGNLYAADAEGERNPDCSELFPIGRDNSIASDGARKLMHYDASTMSTLGVSRLRLRADNEVTRSGVVVVLALYTDASTPDRPYYLGVDADGNVLYPTVCDFTDGSGPKVFLASDPEKGLHMLESDDVKYSVTGGDVGKCYPLMVSGGASKSRQAK